MLFAVYIADIHATVWGQVEESQGISFVDDVTWLAEGRDVAEVVDRLERYAAASLAWADNNAVQFEALKAEAVLFSRKRGNRHVTMGTRVRGHTVHFNNEATRWLGIWLDSTLSLAENRHRRIGKTRQAETDYAASSPSMRTTQVGAVRSGALPGR